MQQMREHLVLPTTEHGRREAGSIGSIEHATEQLALSESSNLFSSRAKGGQRPGARLLQRVLTSRSKPIEKDDINLRGSLGLNTLFSPSDPLVEYVFIHGLGGGSTKTWCLKPDLSYFWPKEWLPHHPGFRNVRAHSFGYNSDWGQKGTTYVDIPDFGQALLAAMRNSECFSKNPIVLVGHSMGGLVAKERTKTYMMARQDPSCQDLGRRISAMVFLATPHRGSDYAAYLSNLLRMSATHTSRHYVNSLEKSSTTLARINDTFRHFCGELALHSFFEAEPLSFGIGNSTYIVTKDSAVLGYPTERVCLLNADHRSICKFSSPSDANYVSLTDAFASINRDLESQRPQTHQDELWGSMKQIEEYLGMPEVPEDDFKDLEDIRMLGSCDWFTDRTDFQEWLTGTPADSPRLLWVHAKPATGKSVLSGHVIGTVDGLNYDCSYYFLRYGDKVRSTASGCLLSLLWQMALRNRFVRDRILSMIDHGVRFERDNAKNIWRKLLEPVMNSPDLTQTQFWIIDALDECSEVSNIFMVLSKLEPTLPLKIFVTSRRTDEIVQGFMNLGKIPNCSPFLTAEIQAHDTHDAISSYLESNKHKLHVGTGLQGQFLLERILEKSQGCFLWVRLVLEELSTVWTLQQVEQVLEEVPQEMDLLYSRALEQMGSRPAQSVAIARAIIMWTLCAIRPMTVEELQAALQLDIGTMVQDPHEGIPSLCSQLIHVDKNGRVLMVHLTAKTFLQNQGLGTSLAICPVKGHQHIAKVCLEYLVSDGFKPPKGRRASDKSKSKKRAGQQKSPFAGYAAFNFAEHMRRTTSNNGFITPLLYELLSKNVFTWIEMVAASGGLQVLTRTADVMKNYLQRQAKYFPPLGEQVQVIDMWAVDLPRLVAKFGAHLVRQPGSIHWLVPPFCPRSSAVAMVFGKPAKRIDVVGLEDNGWDDRLACIDSQDTQAYAVACGEGYFAVGFGTSVTLCHATTCQQWKKLEHGSAIRHLGFDRTGNLLVSVGRRDIKVWDLEANSLRCSFDVGQDILTFSLTGEANGLVVALKSSTIIRWSLDNGAVLSESSWEAGFEDEGQWRRPPILAAFSPDETILTIAYRGRPIKVWDLEEDELLGYLGRESGQDLERLALGSNTSPSSLAFNADDGVPLLAVAYEDGDLCLFDYEDLRLLSAAEINAQVVACSPDGTTLATGNSAGMVQLLEFESLQLLFRVNAADYGVRGLAFSSDGGRFLDARGTQCNVWEPALPSAKTRKDDASSIAGAPPPRVVGLSDGEVEITTVAAEESSEYFFVGKSDGSAWVCAVADGKPKKLLYRHGYQMSLTMMVWGDRRRILVTADIAGRFIAYQLERDLTSGFSAGSLVLDVRAPVAHTTAVVQMLLSPENDLLLVSTRERDVVWDLEGKRQVSHHDFGEQRPHFDWVNSPVDPSMRVLLTADGAAVWDWRTSSEKVACGALPLRLGEGLAGRRINSTTRAFGDDKIALEVVEDASDVASTPTSTVVLLDASPLSAGAGELVPSRVFEAVCGDVLHVVGAFGQRLVFLDKKLCVCSVERLSGGGRGGGAGGGGGEEGFRYVNHFFIPSDWYSQRRTLMMKVTGKGDVLFVRAEEVAVIKHGLAFEGEKREAWGRPRL